TSGALKADGGRFASTRWPENPFGRIFFRQRRRKREFKRASPDGTKLSLCFSFLIFCKSFRTYHDIVLSPNDQVRTTLGDACRLRLTHQIVELIQRLLQPPVCYHASKARYRQHKQ